MFFLDVLSKCLLRYLLRYPFKCEDDKKHTFVQENFLSITRDQGLLNDQVMTTSQCATYPNDLLI